MKSPFRPKGGRVSGHRPEIEPYYCEIESKTFRTRGPFIAKIAELVKRIWSSEGRMTIRQVFYKAVNAAITGKDQSDYEAVQQAILDGRVTGQVAWNVIEDRGRKPFKPHYHDSPLAALENLRGHFRLDLNAGQRYRVEVWLEQAALAGVVQPVCDDLMVPMVVCNGFTSHGALFDASERMRHYRGMGQTGVILLLSDLDPSGVAMAPYIARIVTKLCGIETYVQRIGLTMAQATQHGVYGHGLKPKDSRAPAFRRSHGDTAYELDGLAAHVLRKIVRDAVEPMIDWATRSEMAEKSRLAQKTIEELIAVGKEDGLL